MGIYFNINILLDMSGWDTYVHQIQNTFDPDTNAWAKTGVCQFACVYGHDGNLWAASEGFKLATYEFEMTQEDYSKKKVLCNEHSALMKAVTGDRKGGQECGIRICNQKYMMLRNDKTAEGLPFCTLSRQGGGGACIVKGAQALLVGVWGKDVPMSDGKTQNTGDCEKNTHNVAHILKAAGY